MIKNKILIDNQSQLRDVFKDNSLNLKKNSKVLIHGKLTLGSNICFEGNNILGKNNIIESNCIFKDITLGNHNTIRMSSYLIKSKIDNNNLIGPYAFIRDKTYIKNFCIIGAYVEITRSLILDDIKASHRAFIGDAKVGRKTIIGAGSVFCNYSFKTMKKEKTEIGSNCKIGSNVTIIAPIKIKRNTIIPAFTKYKS